MLIHTHTTLTHRSTRRQK